MKSKLFKKLVAGIATASMAAQFAVVLPASAAEIYTQDFEALAVGKITDASVADSPSAGDSLQIAQSEDTNYGKYLTYATGSQNSRGANVNFTPNVSGKDYYVVEFDAALTPGNNQSTNLAVKSADFATEENKVNYAAGKGYLFLMSTTNSETWTLNKTETATVNITKGAWHHYKLIIDTNRKLTSVMIDGVTVDENGADDPVIVGIDGSSTDVNGIYILAGRYYPVIDLDNIVVRDKEDTDVFGELKDENLSSIEWSAQINKKISQPAENEPEHIPVTVKATGNYGSDLTDKADITWTVTGLDNEDGYISLTKDEGAGQGTEGVSPDGSATAYFNVRNGVSNWYGKVNATVTYKDVTKTISTPFAVIGASGGGNNLAPDAGYPESMSSFDDALVDYVGTANGITDKDIVLNNWSFYGSNGTRSFSLKKDEDGTKYLNFVINGGSGSAVPVYQLANQSSQYIVDMTVRFTGGNMTFGHYNNTPNNGTNSPNWTCSYGSGALSVGTQSISGLNGENWYRIVVSADESAGTYWVKVYNPDGSLLGETDNEALLASATSDQRYFAFQGSYPLDLASFKIYYPSVAAISINGEETIAVPATEKDPNATAEPTAEPKTTTEPTSEPKATTEPTAQPTSAPAELIEYDAETKVLTVNSTDSPTAKLFVAEYADNGALASVETKDLTFADGVATISDFTKTDTSKLFVWDSVKGMKPLTAPKAAEASLLADDTEEAGDTDTDTDTDNDTETGGETGEAVDADGKKYVTKDYTAIVTTAEGFDISSPVTWSVDTEDEAVTIAATADNSHNAVLTVKEGAAAGPVTITAVCGTARAEKTVNLTTTGSAINFSKSTSSLTIPFSGEDAVTGTFEASTIDKDGNAVEFAVDKDGNATTTPAAITYSVLDKNLTDITNSMPAGVSFDTATGVLTVTDQAKARIIYIQAKNNDEIPLSRSIKVNIHGMSFAFGNNEPADDSYTQVTDDAYTDKTGYGFASSASVTVEDSDVKGTSDYRFKVKVPNGNYAVNVVTTSESIKSEVVESVTADTGITKTGTSFNVAVCDEVLDLTFASASTLSSLTITQSESKTALSKPAVYAIGDSTTNNNANGAKSWGNYASEHKAELIGDVFSDFANHGMAGRDSVNYYNQGRAESVLLSICPGDYVTVNMGINSKETNEGASYETLISEYYVEGILQRGGIPVIVTATPDGPVGNNLAADYDASTGRFTNNRGNGARNDVLRRIAQNKQLNLIELGQAGEDWLNTLTDADVAAYNAANETAFTTVLEMVQSWYADHNHYREPMAKWVSEYIFKTLKEINADPTAYVPVAED